MPSHPSVFVCTVNRFESTAPPCAGGVRNKARRVVSDATLPGLLCTVPAAGRTRGDSPAPNLHLPPSCLLILPCFAFFLCFVRFRFRFHFSVAEDTDQERSTEPKRYLVNLAWDNKVNHDYETLFSRSCRDRAFGTVYQHGPDGGAPRTATRSSKSSYGGKSASCFTRWNQR